MTTYTPDLELAVLARLREYSDLFAVEDPQAGLGVLLHGLLTEGDRKSADPFRGRRSVSDHFETRLKPLVFSGR